MKLTQIHRSLLALALGSIAITRASADLIVTTNGAQIVGKITLIHGGDVSVSTEYAGDIKIKQSKIVSITTDRPVAVKLTSGTRIDGVVTPNPSGGLEITSPDGIVNTSLPKVAATWTAGDEDPDVIALRRHWVYEADVDIEGKNGNHNQLGTDLAFKAKVVSPTDTLAFATEYNRQVTDGAKSSDQFRAGVDYADNFSDRSTWFVRDEAGFDRVMEIRFYDIAAAGLGYAFVKTSDETLTGRAGLSYRYDDYITPGTPLLSSPGADFEIDHALKLPHSQLTNHIAFVPAFNNFSDYFITHQSAYEIPLANPAWKLKFGIENDYNSKPPKGVKTLDTTYFTRLVLNWGQ